MIAIRQLLSRWWKKLKSILVKLIPWLVLIALPVAFFGSAIWGQDLIVAGDFTGSDLLDLNYPFKVALAESIKTGQVPLWTQYLSNGYPLLAEGQMGAFYPPNVLLALLLPPHLALTYSLLIVFILAGLFTYLYARSLKLKPFAALTAAVIFTFSGFFITKIKHLNLIAVAGWTPLVFWMVKKFFTTRNLRWAFITGLVLAGQFLAGHPQIAFFSVFVFAIYFIFEFWLTAKRKGFAYIFAYALSALIIIALVTGGLAAIQVLPTWELAQYTEKTEYTLSTATAYPFHPKNLVTFISPYYFGNPALGSYKENVQLMGIFWENCSYIGLLPLLLIPWVVIRLVKKLKKRQQLSTSAGLTNLRLIFLFFLAIFSLILMLGRYTPVFGFLWHYLPGFAYFRFPNRFNLFLIFSLAILAGKGMGLLTTRLEQVYRSGKAFRGKQSETRVRFTWPLDRVKTQILILAFLVADLFVFGKNYVGWINAGDWLKTPESVKYLREENPDELYRILSVSQYSDSPYQFLGWKQNTEPLVKIREAIPPDANLVWQVPTLSDRSWFEGGYNFKRRNYLERWLLEEAKDQFVVGKVLGVLNVKYILSFAPEGGLAMELKKSVDLGETYALDINIFENSQNLPRIDYIPEAEVVDSEEAAFSKISSNEFYPPKTVILEKAPQNPLPQMPTTLDDFKNRNPLEIVKYADQEIIIKAQLQDPGFLVISDTFFPGWQATVNGEPREILPANYLIRALEMTPSEEPQTIRMYYDPLPFKIGAYVSGATAGLLVVLTLTTLLWRLVLVRLWRRWRRIPSPAGKSEWE